MPKPENKTLLTLVLLHAAASLLHFVHNAEFLMEYPNMPLWLSPPKIYLAWLAEAAVGGAGVILFLRGRLTGLFVIAAYAVLGLAGLDHYMLAPMREHTITMNVMIWLETATAVALLICSGAVFAARPSRGWRQDSRAR